MSNLFSSNTLDGEVALVTGASRGIGASIAAALVAAGARVIGTATSQGGADGIDDALGEQGRGIVLNVAPGIRRGHAQRHSGNRGQPDDPRKQCRYYARQPAHADEAGRMG